MLFLILLSACVDQTAKSVVNVTCPEGELLDGSTCVPEECGLGLWGGVPVDADAVYVDVGAAEGGVGSSARPLTSIQAGVDLAGDRGGGLVAVAAGVYREAVSMGNAHDGVTLAGRCRELVTLDGTDLGEVPGVQISGTRNTPSIAIEGLTLSGGPYPGLWLQQANVSVARSDVHAHGIVGVVADEAEVTLDDVGVYGTLSDPHGEFGQGIQVGGASSVTVTGSIVQGNSSSGVVASGAGVTVDLVETEVLDTAPVSDVTGGQGLWVEYGATLTATRCKVQGNSDSGVLVFDAGTKVELVDTQVLDTHPLADGSSGAGVSVNLGATLTASGSTVERNTMAGLYASGAGTRVELVDTEILDTSAAPAGEWGRGIEVDDGATLTANHCIVQGNHSSGVYAGGAGTTIELMDTQVLGTVALPDGTRGNGIEVEEGASLTATSCTIQGSAGGGVFGKFLGTTIALVDTAVLDCADDGLAAQDGASVTANGCTIQRTSDVGLYASGAGTTIDLVETEILDTSVSPAAGHGRGIVAQNGARVTASRCTVQGNTEIGVFAAGVDAHVDLVDTLVLETHRGRDYGLALGMAAQDDAEISARNTEISDSDGPGVYVVDGGRVQLDQSLLARNGFAGALALHGSLTFATTTITDTLPDDEWGGGFGVYTTDYHGSASISLLDSTIGPQVYAAVWLDGPGAYDIERNDLSGSAGVIQGGYTLHGNAVFAENGVTAWDGASGLLLSGNTIREAAGIGVLLQGSSATLVANGWSGNLSDLRQQDCDGPDGVIGPGEGGLIDDVAPLTVDDLVAIPTAVVCPANNVLTAYDLVFDTLRAPTPTSGE